MKQSVTISLTSSEKSIFSVRLFVIPLSFYFWSIEFMNLSIAKLALVAAVMLQGASFANPANTDMFQMTEATNMS